MSIVKDSTYIFSSQIIGFVLGMVNSIVISRVLGPCDRGVYFLVLTVNALFVTFGDFGVGFTNTYLLSKKKRTLNEIHSNSIFTIIFISIISYMVYWLIKDYLNSTMLKGVNPIYTLVGIALIPASLYSSYWNFIMGGLKKFVLMSKLGILFSSLGTAMVFIILLVLRMGIEGLLAWWVVNSILMIIVRLCIVNDIEKIKVRFNKKVFREVLWFGFKGHIGNISDYINRRFDMFIVNFFTGTAGVGFYSLSVSLAEKTWVLPSTILSVIPPRIAERQKDESGLLVCKTIRHTLLISFSTAVLLLLITPWLLPILYGDKFRPSVIPLLILLGGVPIKIVAVGLAQYITYQLGKPQISSIITWITTIIYIPFSILMISRYGIIGAAFSTTFAYVMLSAIFVVLFKRYSGILTSDIFLAKASDLTEYCGFASKVFQRARAYLVYQTS